LSPINWEEKPFIPPSNSQRFCTILIAIHKSGYVLRDGIKTEELEYTSSGTYQPETDTSKENLNATQIYTKPEGITHRYPNTAGIWGYNRFDNISVFNRIINTSDNDIYQPDDIIMGLSGSETQVYLVLNRIYSNETIVRAFSTLVRKVTYSVIYSTCSLPVSPPPPPPPPPNFKYLGNASPPPPPPRKKMSCCDCNTIATIVENQSILQIRAQEKLVENLKDHIDKRAVEIIIKDLEHLKALDFEEFLKALMQRINESEANLWNGVQQ